ncbi:hypothetical protein, conserved [Plasmodium gonderi]|uniref:CCZ1/INTU/HSP4 first Longin domain-containing protein n=1 Tax=Plasmodium gonderi TaxID=77519 RepID=A0A1Y1JF21_PLAGO|nr:hypothetical protein, conserved [Plasmodium gonderi]GAW80850.1 hypothetical protein, conserved [Plasmodium gonderi]
MDRTKIDAFFIYDEDVKKDDKSVTDEELQAEKVIYYYPNEIDENIKVTHTSTMEGISAFLSQFSKSHMDHIITHENLIVINKWYKHVFVAIVVKNIYKNDKMELLMCKLLHSILNNFISIFTLLHGHIRTFLKYKKYKTTENMNRKTSLQTLLDDYVFTYINTINNECISIHNDLQSFHFFPVEKRTYITVQNLISSLILEHKQIKHGSLFYEGHLIYSSLEMNEMKTIYNYLVSYSGTVNNLKLNQHPFKKIASSAAINANGGLSSFARCNSIEDKNSFLLGIKKSSVFMPVVTLSGEKKHKLVAFIFRGILLMLLIKGNTIKDEDFDILIDVQNKCTNENSSSIYNLLKLNETLSVHFKKYLNQDDSVRYFYYNHFNNCIKYSFNNKKLSNEELLLVADFHFLLNDSETKYNKIKLNKNMFSKNKEKSYLSNELFNFEHSCIQKNCSKNDPKSCEQQENKKHSQSVTQNEAAINISETGKSVFSQNQHERRQNSNKTDIGSEINSDKTTEIKSDHVDEQKLSSYNLDSSAHITTEEKHQSEGIHVKTENSKKYQSTLYETQKKNTAAGVECREEKKKTKLKLILNEELKKKLFEDTSDDVKIEKIFFKEANGPWIFAKKSLQRELFIFPDDSKISLSKAQRDIQHLMDVNFSNIYI